jgi:hypothetical protein
VERHVCSTRQSYANSLTYVRLALKIDQSGDGVAPGAVQEMRDLSISPADLWGGRWWPETGTKADHALWAHLGHTLWA